MLGPGNASGLLVCVSNCLGALRGSGPVQDPIETGDSFHISSRFVLPGKMVVCKKAWWFFTLQKNFERQPEKINSLGIKKI